MNLLRKPVIVAAMMLAATAPAASTATVAASTTLPAYQLEWRSGSLCLAPDIKVSPWVAILVKCAAVPHQEWQFQSHGIIALAGTNLDLTADPFGTAVIAANVGPLGHWKFTAQNRLLNPEDSYLHTVPFYLWWHPGMVLGYGKTPGMGPVEPAHKADFTWTLVPVSS